MSSRNPAEMVTVSIDGIKVQVPKGTLLIRAAEAVGIVIPRFCDHPLLQPAGACRQCLVSIPDAGNGRGLPAPQPACTTEVQDQMVVETAATCEAIAQAQSGILELMLINHPLDCPICDKAGECPLQNQAQSFGPASSRYDGLKRTYPKPVKLSELILLDRERCILCTRCIRFAEQIAGDPTISLIQRGAKQQVGVFAETGFNSYFSGNVVQICPVGALTSSDYRFAARPFDLVSTVTTCDNCASGCQLRVDARHFQVERRNAGQCPEINQEWICDKGRFGYLSARGSDRLTRPMVRQSGQLVETSWPAALEAAATGLTTAGSAVGVLIGGRMTLETSYAYSRFARTILKTNSIDFRARASSHEEAEFLAQFVASNPAESAVKYADLEKAEKVILIGFEPEEESPAVFLRLRQANRQSGLAIFTIAEYLSHGSAKLNATLITAKPNDVPDAIRQLKLNASTIVLVGERLAQIPGAYFALAEKMAKTRARLAWVPRRAGEIGAIKAGCLPDLLPGGRRLANESARTEINQAWSANLPTEPGMDANTQFDWAGTDRLCAIVMAGIDADDFRDPELVLAAADNAFTICLESRLSPVAARADVVLPVDLLEQTSGTFLNWEHRACSVNQVVTNPRSPMTEIRVLAALAQQMSGDLGFRSVTGAAKSWAQLPFWEGEALVINPVDPCPAPPTGVVVSTWRELIDNSRCLDGANAVLSTAHLPLARISPQTRRTEGLATSSYVRLSGPKGSVTFPLQVEPGMADGVIWAPMRAVGRELTRIGVPPGEPVTLAAAAEPKKEGEE